MSYWGKVIGGFAGLVMGGPFGAVMGAALGHAADQGAIPRVAFGPGMNPARVAAMLGGRDQLFAIGVVVLSAKLAKCDGPVVREEIDAFKRNFRIPPAATRDIGRLFDQARDSNDSFEPYARQLGDAFADAPGVLEDVMGALFAIARADKPVNGREMEFLERVHTGFRLNNVAWDRVRGATQRVRMEPADDAYATLGVPRSASNDEVRQAWRTLVRANHPDSLAARGVPKEFVASATNKVAGINAAWDIVKRERGL
jgi:DnaJ like chaperone protein